MKDDGIDPCEKFKSREAMEQAIISRREFRKANEECSQYNLRVEFQTVLYNGTFMKGACPKDFAISKKEAESLVRLYSDGAIDYTICFDNETMFIYATPYKIERHF